MFDELVLRGIPLLTADRGTVDIRSDRGLRHDERRWQQEWQVLVAGVQREGSALTAESVERGMYLAVPRCWDCFEVSWGFYAECLRGALLWGMELAAAPYQAEETPREREALENDLWSTVMSQLAQSVAVDLLSEAEGAAGGA